MGTLDSCLRPVAGFDHRFREMHFSHAILGGKRPTPTPSAIWRMPENDSDP